MAEMGSSHNPKTRAMTRTKSSSDLSAQVQNHHPLTHTMQMMVDWSFWENWYKLSEDLNDTEIHNRIDAYKVCRV